MRLAKARIQNYRSIRDTGEFEVEALKTIMVGPNEAGKSAVLQALQQINAPKGIKGFDPLRDYPRALFNEISTGETNPDDVVVVTATFTLSESDLKALPEPLRASATGYEFNRYLNNTFTHSIIGVDGPVYYKTIKPDLARLVAHLDRDDEGQPQAKVLAALGVKWSDWTSMTWSNAAPLHEWLESIWAKVDEDDTKEVARYRNLCDVLEAARDLEDGLAELYKRRPLFVLFSNYFRVRPNIHLAQLAARLESNVLDDDQYDYGNTRLLKLLGFEARQLSDLGRAPDPAESSLEAMTKFRDQLDNRSYQLNAASVALTREITRVWNPNEAKGEASRLHVRADGQYLKVVVEDDMGVDVELDQRSEGFQWLVSFFIVFFAERKGEHQNAILLLDEPGVSLHALKQKEFRETISRLAADNQTIFTTHSPFMVGPDELDLVRVVELSDRNVGTKVHTSITSSDPAALLPLQEALGYDLAQSLFMQQKNLVLEGLTDLFYLEAAAGLLADDKAALLDNKIALVPSSTASKVVYYATILHAQGLKVAALLDSDNAGNAAASQEMLVHRLGQKKILRTGDYAKPPVAAAEIEDLFRKTLVKIAKAEFGWDIEKEASARPDKPVIDVFLAVVGKNDFSKYKLAKAFVRWTRDHNASDLTPDELAGATALIAAINAALK